MGDIAKNLDISKEVVATTAPSSGSSGPSSNGCSAGGGGSSSKDISGKFSPFVVVINDDNHLLPF